MLSVKKISFVSSKTAILADPTLINSKTLICTSKPPSSPAKYLLTSLVVALVSTFILLLVFPRLPTVTIGISVPLSLGVVDVSALRSKSSKLTVSSLFSGKLPNIIFFITMSPLAPRYDSSTPPPPNIGYLVTSYSTLSIL